MKSEEGSKHATSLLRLKFYFSVLVAFITNFRKIGITSLGLKQRAASAFIMSKVSNKERLRSYFSIADHSRMTHLAYQLFLISQRARFDLDIVDSDFQLSIQKDGILYKFKLIPTLDLEKAPFVHDLFPFRDIFTLRLYDLYPCAGGVVVDVGGYVGDTAIYFAKKGARKVYAYEPNPVNYKYLVMNVDLNGVSEIVVPRNCGISTQRSRLFVPREMGGGGSMYTPKAGDVSYEVVNLEPCTIFEHEEQVSLLKLDCKGCEQEILRRCIAELRRKVQCIIVEVYRLNDRQRGDLISEVISNGFRLDRVNGDMLYFSNQALTA